MSRKLINSISLLLLLCVAAVGQTKRAGPSVQERGRELEPFIIESAKRYGIDVRILRAVCFVESRYRADAISPKGARGLMQFMPDTAARYGLKNPHDPKAAIDAAAHYLRDLLDRFHGRVDLALAAYNAGEGAVESFRTGTPLVLRTGKIINARRLVTGGVPPYPETRAYVRSILIPLIAPQPTSQKSTSSELTGNRFHSLNGQNSILNTTTNPAIKDSRRLNSFIDVQ